MLKIIVLLLISITNISFAEVKCEGNLMIPEVVYKHREDFLANLSVTMPNNEASFKKLIKLADDGNSDANWMLAVIYHHKNRHTVLAAKRYQISITRKDSHYTDSMVNLAAINVKNGDYHSGIKLYLEAGINGDYMGFQELGTLYLLGKGVEQDFVKSKEYYLKAEKLGCVQCEAVLNQWDKIVEIKKKDGPLRE
ncbi:sel1 repeat family protein [Serratia nevei]|nr:sel1 repeat family protein [Serratia nevei]